MMLFILWLAVIGFTIAIAVSKNRSWFGWGVLAFLFPLLSMLAVIGMPPRPRIDLARFEGDLK